jgi:carbon storage regulator
MNFNVSRRVMMLVLTRRKNEAIVIGNNVVVTVADIRGDKVRIGIEAPKEISVHRKEVQELLDKEAKREQPSELRTY